jgi:hypothetical protein
MYIITLNKYEFCIDIISIKMKILFKDNQFYINLNLSGIYQ